MVKCDDIVPNPCINFCCCSLVREFDISAADLVVDKRQDLLDVAGNLALDVALYDDHYTTGKNIKVIKCVKNNQRNRMSLMIQFLAHLS